MSQINALVSGLTNASGTKSRVLSAIQNASAKTGVDFAYLLNKAEQESGLDPAAKAKTSSATGLYQFIDQTWLATVKQNGDKYGLGAVADKISMNADGVASVANEADRKAILDLRKDPVIAASMAAEFAKANKAQLQAEVGGDIGSTELYLAHFLGASGASDFLKAMKTNPEASAAEILPQAASANKNVFFDKVTGAAKSLSEIYQRFAQKFEKAPDSSLTTKVALATHAPATSKEGEAVAKAVENALAHRLAFSSIGGSASGAMATSNGITLDQTTSSPFAAMVLAQMDMETFGLDAMTHADKLERSDNDERRKSILSTLSDAA